MTQFHVCILIHLIQHTKVSQILSQNECRLSVKIMTDTNNNKRDNAKDIEKSIGHSSISIL